LVYAFPVFGKPRKLDTESELYEVALRALMRRAHSVSEMKKLLARRASSNLLAQVVMARLKETGQLDDARFARQFVRQHMEIRRQGKFRIARDLRARGVPDTHIEAALEEIADQNDECAIVRKRIVSKLKMFRGEIDDRKMASMYRSLLRAGFSSDVIRRDSAPPPKKIPANSSWRTRMSKRCPPCNKIWLASQLSSETRT
jgi:regulatory protein